FEELAGLMDHAGDDPARVADRRLERVGRVKRGIVVDAAPLAGEIVLAFPAHRASLACEGTAASRNDTAMAVRKRRVRNQRRFRTMVRQWLKHSTPRSLPKSRILPTKSSNARTTGSSSWRRPKA